MTIVSAQIAPFFTQIQMARYQLASPVPYVEGAAQTVERIGAGLAPLSLGHDELAVIGGLMSQQVGSLAQLAGMVAAIDQLENRLREAISFHPLAVIDGPEERLKALVEGRLQEYDWSRQRFYLSGVPNERIFRSDDSLLPQASQVMEDSLSVERRVRSLKGRAAMDRSTEAEVVASQAWPKEQEGHPGISRENFQQAFRLIQGWLADPTFVLTERVVKVLHRTVTSGMAIDKSWHHYVQGPGMYRKVIINPGVGHYSPHPWQLRGLMREFIDWYYSSEMQRLHPIERGARAYQRLIEIHPFRDGNRRTAQMILFYTLMKAGYPIPAPRPKQTVEEGVLHRPFVGIAHQVVSGVGRHLDFIERRQDRPAESFGDYQEALFQKEAAARRRRP